MNNFLVPKKFVKIQISKICLAVHQSYTTKAEDEYVIRGNDVILKCKIPSFVSDFVDIVGWVDSEGSEISKGIAGSLGRLNNYRVG